jgi:hypothetical protein
LNRSRGGSSGLRDLALDLLEGEARSLRGEGDVVRIAGAVLAPSLPAAAPPSLAPPCPGSLLHPGNLTLPSSVEEEVSNVDSNACISGCGSSERDCHRCGFGERGGVGILSGLLRHDLGDWC